MQDTYRKLEAARDLATSTEEDAKSSMKRWYDQKARNRSFEVGDLVLVLLPSSSNKLLAKWQGPFPITEKLSETTFRVRMEESSRPNRTYHINMMSKWEVPSAVCLLGKAADTMHGPSKVDISTWPEVKIEDQTSINPELEVSQIEQIKEVLEKHKKLFTDQPRRTDQAATCIYIKTGESTPIHSHLYRLPHARQETVKKEISQLLRADLIEVSTSVWASPIVLLPKKDGSLRLCVDYRKLNAVTRPDPFTMPRIDDLTDGLAGARYITTLDLTKGYWQVPVEAGYRDKTAFITQFGKCNLR